MKNFLTKAHTAVKLFECAFSRVIWRTVIKLLGEIPHHNYRR